MLLAAVWGSSFLFMRIAAPDWGPWPLVEMRLVLGAALLLPLFWRERSQFTHVPQFIGTQVRFALTTMSTGIGAPDEPANICSRRRPLSRDTADLS